LRHLLTLLHHHSNIDRDELEGRALSLEDEGAVKHLFNVASALESVVLGENQIIGQLKDDYRFAHEQGTCGIRLTRLFDYAFKCAAAVKSETKIGQASISVASASVAQSKQVVGSIGGRTVVVLGSGEMAELCCKHLIACDANILLVNRNKDKAELLANSLGDCVYVEPYEKLAQLINSHNLFFSAVGAMEPVITDDMVERKTFKRFWFDLGVPRNISPDINCANTVIYTVDDLQHIVNENMALRQEEAKHAYKIVGQHTNDFFNWLQALSVDPIIKALRSNAQSAARGEITKAIKKGFLPSEYEKTVAKMMHNAFNTFLHSPTVSLKDIAEHPRPTDMVDVVRHLFDIDEECEVEVTKKG